MKKHFFQSLIVVLTFLIHCTVSAQVIDLSKPAPFDTLYRFGRLENGLTYYIRTNNKPEKRAEFYIVHNVGAILEEDYQNGLAHFTEHMAFNGTTNFPKKNLLNYLETIGCKFGQNVNAFTGQDVTCYNISSVPLYRPGITDTCLLILHDWSNQIAFDPEEIDKERGVIIEEWRTRGGAQSRLRDKTWPILLKGSKYSQRNVIGDTSVIRNFKYNDIKDYYHNWYRPDLQAVIIVGDFDAMEMEEKVKKVFSTIPTPINPQSKPFFSIPDNDSVLIAIATDPEATQTQLTIYFKQNRTEPENKNLNYLRQSLMMSLINQMINNRIAELLQKENSPCTQAGFSYSGFTSAKDAFIGWANIKDNQTKAALSMLMTEGRRMQQHGFLPSELEREKSNFLRSIENAYADRFNRKSNELVWPCFNHFTENEPLVNIGFYKDFTDQMIQSVSLEEINEVAKKLISGKNVVISLTAPEKSDTKIVSENELLETLNPLFVANVEAYSEELTHTSLLERLPQAGKITSIKKNKLLDASVWDLSNGMRVIFKHTEFKEDEFSIVGISKGGATQMSDSLYLTAIQLGAIIKEMGLGAYSKTDLNKVLAGKLVGYSVGVGNETESVSGGGSPRDMETVMQLIHLYFTQPRFDEKAFQTLMSKYKTAVENRSLEPRSAFSDSINTTLWNHHPLKAPITVERLREITYPRVIEAYRDRIMQPDMFTWLIIGNIDTTTTQKMVELYLASLPSGNRREKFQDKGLEFTGHKVVNHFHRDMKNPKVSVFTFYQGNMKESLKNYIYLNTIKQILDIRYTETLREEEGGTYGVSVQYGFAKQPRLKGYLSMNFDTNTGQELKLTQIVHQELDSIMQHGPSSTDLMKVKEFLIKAHNDRLKENDYWLNVMDDWFMDHFDSHSSYLKYVNEMTTRDIQRFAASLFDQEKYIEVVMKPQ